ncbi:MAG TPA: DUF2155 domain-containing protein [Caulobacteraceae bacterium]|nr:DUF2155 domain-containing protein [Caulobacteraceae bacterium]
MVARVIARRWRVALAAMLVAGSAGLVSAQGAPPVITPDKPAKPSAPEKVKPSPPAPPSAPAEEAAPAAPGNATSQLAAPADEAAPPANETDGAQAKGAAAAQANAAPVKPAEPPKPIRSTAAIMQALDKVTAETIRFEVPVGRRIRYKTLVFQVKTCETTGVDDPQPQSAAYLIVESQPPAVPGHAPPPRKQVYKGWMFATAPGLHPLEHPVYDAWLIACSAAAPGA